MSFLADLKYHFLDFIRFHGPEAWKRKICIWDLAFCVAIAAIILLILSVLAYCGLVRI
jgi:hypothetical protein